MLKPLLYYFHIATPYEKTLPRIILSIDNFPYSQKPSSKLWFRYFRITEAQPDTIAPVIVSTVPDNKDINQLTYIVITVTFSENVQLGSNACNITIKKGKTYNISISENKLMLDPTPDLTKNSTYVVTIPSGTVIDLAGNTLGSGYTFSFTTSRK